MESQPEELRGETFDRLFAASEIAKLSDEKRIKYQESIMKERDYRAQMQTQWRLGTEEGYKLGVEQGLERGRENMAKSIALRMYQKGVSLEEIAEITELSVPDLKKYLS